MDKSFNYLVWKYGVEGARAEFENICYKLIRSISRDSTHKIREYPGDDGIDVFVDSNGEMSVYQCKYFLNDIGSSQRSQIKKSFKTVMESVHKEYINEWTLCVPTILSSKEYSWWRDWSTEAEEEYCIDIKLMDESELINSLKEYGLYDDIFAPEDRESNKDYINGLKYVVDSICEKDFTRITAGELADLENVVNKYRRDPKFKKLTLIIDIESLLNTIMNETLKYEPKNAGCYVMEDKNYKRKIKKLRQKIADEYYRIFWS